MKHPETDRLADQLHRDGTPMVIRCHKMMVNSQRLEIERDQRAKSSVEWVDASKQLPDDDMTVLIALDDGEVWTGFMDSGVWRYVSADAIEGTVNHWAEFPAPPGEEVCDESNAVRETMLALEGLRFACEHAEGKKEDDRKMLISAMSLGIRILNKHKHRLPDFQRESYWKEVQMMTSSQ